MCQPLNPRRPINIPMPSSLTCWLLPEDKEAFFRYLDQEWDALALPAGYRPDRAHFGQTAMRELDATGQADQFLVTLPSFFSPAMIKPKEFKGDVLFGIDWMNECVLIVQPGKAAGRRLGLSNCAASWHESDSSGHVHPKRHDFVAWGKSVFAWMRRLACERTGDYRMTPAVKKAVDADDIELVLY